ncbi:hypothetical protein GCM10011400_29930 [Paraburkholderia caffeinilytica]|uniref:Uncharacterized protein n=1 Tax=Paraburkholderia caffeinilytica TaxID=1761016 RepID=A0ABQ1MM52_9BURK|nr:hypothetical protein GCM10011400_29930 [Paraburkholderia caffeinilytica]
MINKLGGGLWHSVLLEVATGSDAYEGSAGHASGDRVGIVDRPHPDRQIDPVLHHISHEVRENEIDLKARIE